MNRVQQIMNRGQQHLEKAFKHEEGQDNLWKWFIIDLIAILIGTAIATYSNNFYITVLGISLTIAGLLHFSAGTYMFSTSRKALILKDGRPFVRWDDTFVTTKKGGMGFIEPVQKSRLEYETGMFTIKVKYKNFTLPSKDDAEGEILLNVKINEIYFDILLGVTNGTLDQEVIKNTISHKLELTAPAKLAIASNSLGIKTGFEFEERTKDDKKELAHTLKTLLTTHEGASKDSHDCYGLELLSVETPTPHITGQVYEIDKKTAAAVAGIGLSQASESEWDAYVDQYISNWRDRAQYGKDKKIPLKLLKDLEKEAKHFFNLSKGNATNMHEGLEGVSKIVNITPQNKKSS